MDANGISFDFSFPGLTPPVSLDTTGNTMPTATGSDYLSVLAQIESNNNPNAKAKTSSASGLYQFTKATWEALGGQWGPDDSKPFGGLTPSVDEQTRLAQALTDQNASILDKAGIAINNATLYAAHFLGPQQAVAALQANVSTPISNVVSSAAVSANKFLQGMSVGGFMNWLQGKTG